MPEYRIDPNFKTFHEDITRTVKQQLLESDFSAAMSGMDVSNASTFVYFRAMTMPPGSTYILNTTATKIVGTSTAGDTGKVSADVLFTSSYGEILWGWFIVDTTTAQSGSYSTWKEYLHGGLWAKATVEASVQV